MVILNTSIRKTYYTSAYNNSSYSLNSIYHLSLPSDISFHFNVYHPYFDNLIRVCQ